MTHTKIMPTAQWKDGKNLRINGRVYKKPLFNRLPYPMLTVDAEKLEEQGFLEFFSQDSLNNVEEKPVEEKPPEEIDSPKDEEWKAKAFVFFQESDLKTIQEIPGIGKAVAEKILDRKGEAATYEDFVRGLTPNQLKGVKTFFTDTAT